MCARAVVSLLAALAVAVAGCSENGTEARAAEGVTVSAPSGVDDAGLRRERRITRLLNRAARSVYRAHPDCRPPNPFEQPTTFTDDPPSDKLLAAFAILRRPQVAAERIPDDEMVPLWGEKFYRASYRIATSASGRRYLIGAAQSPGISQRPAMCAQAFRGRFERLLEDRRARFKRAARKALAQVIRDEWSSNPDAAQPRDALFMFQLTESGRIGGGGGGSPLEWVLEHGMLASQGGSRRSIVSGLIPDGVATVEMTFPRLVGRGPHRPPRRYRRTLQITAPVQDNVISIRVNRPARDAFPNPMVWKDAAGATVRVVRPG